MLCLCVSGPHPPGTTDPRRQVAGTRQVKRTKCGEWVRNAAAKVGCNGNDGVVMSPDSSTDQSGKPPVGHPQTQGAERRPDLEVAPSPHLRDAAFTTRRMMIDVL